MAGQSIDNIESIFIYCLTDCTTDIAKISSRLHLLDAVKKRLLGDFNKFAGFIGDRANAHCPCSVRMPSVICHTKIKFQNIAGSERVISWYAMEDNFI